MNGWGQKWSMKSEDIISKLQNSGRLPLKDYIRVGSSALKKYLKRKIFVLC